MRTCNACGDPRTETPHLPGVCIVVLLAKLAATERELAKASALLARIAELPAKAPAALACEMARAYPRGDDACCKGTWGADGQRKHESTCARDEAPRERCLVAGHPANCEGIGDYKVVLTPRDEARRCTCTWTGRTAVPRVHEDLCPARDEARGEPCRCVFRRQGGVDPKCELHGDEARRNNEEE